MHFQEMSKNEIDGHEAPSSSLDDQEPLTMLVDWTAEEEAKAKRKYENPTMTHSSMYSRLQPLDWT